jgi:hypothetical protein
MLFEPKAMPCGKPVVRRFGARPGANVDRRAMLARFRQAFTALRRRTPAPRPVPSSSPRRPQAAPRLRVCRLRAAAPSVSSEGGDDGGGGDGDPPGPPAQSPRRRGSGNVHVHVLERRRQP